MKQKQALAASVILLSLATALPATESDLAVTITVPSLEALSADLRYVGHELMIPRLGAAATNSLVRLLGASAFARIDCARPLHVYALLQRDTPAQSAGVRITPAFVQAARLKGKPDAFLEALATSYGIHDKDGAVHRLSQPASPSSSTPAPLFVATLADRVLAGRNADAVRAVLTLPPQPARSDPLPGCAVTAEIDVQACLPYVSSKMDRLTGMAGTAATGDTAGEARAALGSMKHVQTITLGLAARERSLELKTRMHAKPGTALAGMIGGLGAPAPRYARALPDDSLLAIAGSDLGRGWIPSASDALRFPGSAGGERPERSVADLLTGEYCVGIARRPEDDGLGMVQVYGSEDPSASLAAFRGLLDTRFTQDGTDATGLSVVPRPARRHKGVEIHRYTCSIDAAASGQLAGAAAYLAPFSPFGIEMAATATDIIYTVGPPSVMDHTLARLGGRHAGIAGSPGFAALFGSVPDTAFKLQRIQPVQLLKAILGAAPNVNADMVAVIPDVTGGVAGYACSEDGDGFSVTRIAYDELAGLRGGALLIGSVLAQSMMSGRQAVTGDPQAGVARCRANRRRLAAAKEQYALENGLAHGDTVPVEKLLQYLPGGKLPVCPGDGKYTMGPLGTPPSCSLPAHAVK